MLGGVVEANLVEARRRHFVERLRKFGIPRSVLCRNARDGPSGFRRVVVKQQCASIGSRRKHARIRLQNLQPQISQVADPSQDRREEVRACGKVSTL